MLNHLTFIGKRRFYKYILTLILEKVFCLLPDFNQFYDEGCEIFGLWKYVSIFCFSDILKVYLISMFKLM